MPHLVSVLWYQVVVPELAQEGVRVLHAGHLCFVTVEKPQQFFVFQEVQRVHLRSVQFNSSHFTAKKTVCSERLLTLHFEITVKLNNNNPCPPLPYGGRQQWERSSLDRIRHEPRSRRKGSLPWSTGASLWAVPSLCLCSAFKWRLESESNYFVRRRVVVLVSGSRGHHPL